MNKIISGFSFAAGILLAAGLPAAEVPAVAPLKPQSFSLPDQDSPEVAWWRDSRTNLDERLAWFREARFGMFILWGVYSGLGNEYQGRKG